MITSRFPLGDVSFTAGYFSTLVGEATKHCYGVAAMAPRDMTDAVRSLVHGSDYSEKGVRVTQENGRGKEGECIGWSDSDPLYSNGFRYRYNGRRCPIAICAYGCQPKGNR